MRLLIVLIIVCFSLKVCVLVKGGYLVQVRLNGYSNPTGQCGHSENCHTGELHCCDTSSNTEDCSNNPCDSYFTYCLRPFGEVQLTTSRCSTNQITSHANRGDGPLDFSQSKVLGIDNPQNLSGFEHAYYRVQLYIEIGDKDSGSDEVVDILLVNLNLTVAVSQRQNHTGFYNLVTMDLTITVLCEGNFGGSDCTQCVPGFTGTNCDRRDHCFRVTCSGNGECTTSNNSSSFKCICDPGFTGELCQTNIDDCVGVDCGNGQCVDGVNSFTCGCAQGFAGEHCQTNIDDCVGVNCSGNGECVDGVNSFTCSCAQGFAGELCEINIDNCVGVDCSGNGRCMDGVNSFQCTCDLGFTGELCQTNIDDCVGVNCSGNGQCVDGVNNYTCDCTPGFSGPPCSESDSATVTSTSTNDSGVLAEALGGGISGAVLLLIVILLLTTSCTIALCWSRKSKKMNHYDQPVQEQVYDEIDNQLKCDHEFELKSNEAYGSTTHYIPTEDNVAYGQTTLQISTEDNVAYGLASYPGPSVGPGYEATYGQTTLQISTEDNVAYGQIM